MFYEKYANGRITVQKAICRSLRQTDFAIDYDDLNPMTIRLVSFSLSLQSIKDFVDKTRGQGKRWIFDTNTTAVGTSTSGALFLIYSQHNLFGQKKLKELAAFPVYEALHSFYSNGGSCLDRLSVELDRVYRLEAKQPDFRKLSQPVHRAYPKKLKNGECPQIVELMETKEALQANTFMDYRNREIHDGVIRLEHRSDGHYLPDDPNDINSATYTSELLSVCQSHFSAIETLVDMAYRMMWRDYQEQEGILPLKGRFTL